jgi:protein-L-isoaspartate(D-aspartate) O-methyltransferase
MSKASQRSRFAMTSSDELRIIRRAYARQVMAAAQVSDARVEEAFAVTSREHFLGPGPWPILRFAGDYIQSPSDDPVYLYTNDLVGISPERQINNGQPSLHAHLLVEAAIRPGDHVVHIGAGVGYFTAVMTHLAGPSGRVTAIEFEADLAARAKANLADHPHVAAIEGDGTIAPFDPADVIYVNAGATRPADVWLDRLKDGGRLVLPLSTDKGFGTLEPVAMRRQGAVFVITRKDKDFLARWVSPVAIYPCRGMRDKASERALAAAFQNGGWKRVKRLYRTDDLADDRCWLRAPGWSLAYS